MSIQLRFIKRTVVFSAKVIRLRLKKGLSAEWTGGLVAGSEPFVQTCRVELLFACAASLLRQRVVGSVDDGEADHAVLYSLKTLIHIVLPQSQTLHYTAILMC